MTGLSLATALARRKDEPARALPSCGRVLQSLDKATERISAAMSAYDVAQSILSSRAGKTTSYGYKSRSSEMGVSTYTRGDQKFPCSAGWRPSPRRMSRSLACLGTLETSLRHNSTLDEDSEHTLPRSTGTCNGSIDGSKAHGETETRGGEGA